VKELVLKEQGVKDIGRLRARQIGQKRWIDLEAKFEPQMKVCDVKEAIANVKKKIMVLFEDVADVVIISRVVEPELKEI
jgi:divalent metal cation (Fe/Co/Zn/Cd) transporter